MSGRRSRRRKRCIRTNIFGGSAMNTSKGRPRPFSFGVIVFLQRKITRSTVKFMQKLFTNVVPMYILIWNRVL